jgi:LytS/YehU family sensor histidine kinase
MSGLRDPRKIVFVALMGALGNVMFVVSQTFFKASQIALDLSHIGTFVAAVYGGPWIGFLTGLIVGIGPGLNFGYFGGSLGLLGLIGLPVGKALTGLTVGYITKFLKLQNAKRSAWKVSLATLVGYVPECIFTVVYFEWLVVILLPDVAASFTLYFGSIHLLVLSVLAKAWVEIALLSIFMGTLVGNNGFNDFVTRVFTRSPMTARIRTEKPD